MTGGPHVCSLRELARGFRDPPGDWFPLTREGNWFGGTRWRAYILQQGKETKMGPMWVEGVKV